VDTILVKQVTMTTGISDTSEARRRAYALDALRGLAILGMILSGQIPFGANALPAWMYHAQVPPPEHKWVATLAGITWVDLVFPFFLFALGAAIPLALSRRLEQGGAKLKVSFFIIERGILLGFFALYVEAIRPYVISEHPSVKTWLVALLGFGLLFPVLMRLPEAWPTAWRRGIRTTGWAGSVALLALLHYPGGEGFSLERSDIIIVVLANMAVFGSVVWWLTRANLLLRLGVLGILVAIRLSNMPQAVEGWVSSIWSWSPLPWIYRLYYLQYLFIVVPGTIVGDLLQEWLRRDEADRAPVPGGRKAWSPLRFLAIGLLMLCLPVLLVVGLKARWLIGTTLTTFALCAAGWWLMSKPSNGIERLFHRLFNWVIYWLVLGLFFEPYEGGIKKDRATMSYYFVTAGCAICVLIGLSILIDVFRRKRWVQLLIENGQNPMIAYAGINNLIIPVLALTTANKFLASLDSSPWLGFAHGTIITLLLALSVSFFTKRRILWRT
jgi:predicted acyltransferase